MAENLSTAGANIRYVGRLRTDVHDSMEITLNGRDQSLRLSSRVVWIFRFGFLRYRIGLEFSGISDATKRQLGDLILRDFFDD
jgi:c-di-GMP-binding flagellar brake protein YcgR